MLGQDDFIKFKSPLVFPAELDLLKSMVVCRAYITEHRTTMQFLVFQAANAQKASRVMDMISDMSQQLSRSGQVEDTGARVTGGGGPRPSVTHSGCLGDSHVRGRGGWDLAASNWLFRLSTVQAVTAVALLLMVLRWT